MAIPTVPTLATCNKVCSICNCRLEPLQNWTIGQIKSQSNICRECKNKKSEEWRRNNGILVKQISQKGSAKWREKRRIEGIKYWMANPKKRAWHGCKQNAKKRNILFNLTYNDFLTLSEKNCYYCGDEICTLSGIGIDRLDNKKGYEIGNIVPCCPQCNWMKSDLTIDAFVLHCKKIIKEANTWQHQLLQVSVA